MLKYYLQKLFGAIFSSPLIPKGKTIGYSLVKSERANSEVNPKAKVYAPFYLNKVSVGKYSYISRNCYISDTEIGQFCSIGQNFCCGLGMHPISGISTSPMFYSLEKQNGYSLCDDPEYEEKKPIHIGNDVFIGANVTVLNGVTISDGAVVGAGAVVTKDIPPYAVAVGVPAQIIKYRFSPNTIDSLLEKRWWDLSEDNLQKIENHFWDVDAFLKSK